MGQEERSEALIGVLEDLQESDIGFVLVGGYAVSQFETRFSTDLDLVIAPDDYDEVVTFLEEHDFERDEELEVPPDETVYNREIELFERSEGLVHPVGVDVFVNASVVGRRKQSGHSSISVSTAPSRLSRVGHG